MVLNTEGNSAKISTELRFFVSSSSLFGINLLDWVIETILSFIAIWWLEITSFGSQLMQIVNYIYNFKQKSLLKIRIWREMGAVQPRKGKSLLYFLLYNRYYYICSL